MATTDACVNCNTPLPSDSRFCSKCGTPVPGLDFPTLTPQAREIYDRLVTATEGHYEIVRELGRGGMAVVFLGYQKSLDREVAIKVLLPLLGYDPDLVQRFMREARTQGRLEHPNIISVYEVYNQGGLTFFSMPYVAGQSLRSFLHQTSRPPVETVIRFLRQAAEALGYAHRQGVIHRDVKPDNILIAEERNAVVLTDFGIAKAVSAQTTLTTPGDLLGTPLYMSPEQGEGRQTLDGRADMYSLGLIGYEMLAGQPAFKADNLAELMYRHRFEDPESLDELRPDISDIVRSAIVRAINKLPEDRFADMDEFIAALEGRAPARRVPGGEDDTTEVPDSDSEATLRIVTPNSVKSASPLRGARSEPSAVPITPDTSETIPVGALKRKSGVPVKALGAGAGVVAAAGLLWVFAIAPALERDPAESPAEQTETVADANGGPETDLTNAGVTPPIDADAQAETPVEEPEPQAEDAGGEAVDEVGTTPPVSPPVNTEADRGNALRAQSRVQQTQQDALDAGAAALLGGRLRELDSRLAAANRDMNANRYSAAITAYSALIQEYGALAGDARRLAVARDGAAEAMRATDASRGDAIAAGAEANGARRLTILDGQRDAAQRRFDNGDYSEAQAGFETVSASYGLLATDMLALAEEEAAGGDAPGEEDPPADDEGEPEPTLTSEQVLTGMIERFRQLFEAEDLDGMAAELYKGPVPNDDRRLFKDAIFDNAEGLSADLDVRNLRIEDDESRARADVRLETRFTNQVGDVRDLRVNLRLEFVSGPQGWRLRRAGAR